MISFKKSFSILLSNDEILINNSHDIDIALIGRTNPSPNRVIKLLESGETTLDNLEEENRTIESTIHEILVLGENDIKSFYSKLKSLPLDKIAKDNDWKAIIKTFINNKDIPSQATRLTLIKYLEYLKKVDVFIEFARAKVTDNEKNKHKINTNTHHEGYIQLPKNHPVSIKFPENKIINIFLGNHAYKLIIDKKWSLLSPKGDKHYIKIGKNKIGRSKKNDICLGKKFNDLSRVHIVIERINESTATFMDTSSLGTYLPENLF